jgi:hypothetical protein
MAAPESLREIFNLRLRLQMNNRLRLETLAALSKVFREYNEPLRDELLASVVLALPEELPGTSLSTYAGPPPGTPPGTPPGPPGTPPGTPPGKPGTPPGTPPGKPGTPPAKPGTPPAKPSTPPSKPPSKGVSKVARDQKRKTA